MIHLPRSVAVRGTLGREGRIGDGLDPSVLASSSTAYWSHGRQNGWRSIRSAGFCLIRLTHMTQTTAEASAQPVLLMLVDISGYTKFMVSHDEELRHSQMIIGALL